MLSLSAALGSKFNKFPTQNRFISAISVPGSPLTISFRQLDHKCINVVKLRRVQREWEKFKLAYEAPHIKVMEHFERTRNVKARKFYRTMNKRDIKARKRFFRIRKVRTEEKDERFEFEIQKFVREILEEGDVTMGHFLLGTHPDTRQSELLGLDDILRDYPLKFKPFMTQTDPSNRIGLLEPELTTEFEPKHLRNTPDYWKWEKNISKSELIKILASDILSYGIGVREDLVTNEGSLKIDIEREYHKLGNIDPTLDYKDGFAIPFDDREYPIDVNFPACIPNIEISHKKFYEKKLLITGRENRRAFILERDLDPNLLARSKRQRREFRGPYVLRKVKLLISVSLLRPFPIEVKERLICLASRHYNSKTKKITIISHKMPTTRENVKHVFSMARALFNEAWKAHLNYVPPLEDPLNAHLTIEQIIVKEEMEKSIKDHINPDTFIDPDKYTFINVFDHPKSSYFSTRQKQLEKSFNFFLRRFVPGVPGIMPHKVKMKKNKRPYKNPPSRRRRMSRQKKWLPRH